MKVVVFFLTCLLFAPAFGQGKQAGAIKGKIVDGATGETVPGIQVNLVGSEARVESDIEGEFLFSDLAQGLYAISISDMSYAAITITEIGVVNGETTVIDVKLEEPKDTTSQELEGAVVTARRNQESVNTLLLNQMNSSNLSDGVSAQILRTMPVRTSADALKVVSGASIQDNKFAVIRGLNDRYNAAYLNGGALPSSEADRKAFSFDIFPANMIEQLIISKTATPDQQAEFAGGVIQITTKSIPNKKFYSISAGAGYNTITTFKAQQTYKGGKLDWLGVDDGNRAVPSAIPAYGNYPININDQAALAQKFSTNWNLVDRKFSPNYNFQFSTGFNPMVFKKEVGIITSITYNRSFSFTETQRRGYTNGPSSAQASQIDYDYLDKNNTESVLAGGMANFFIKLNERNSVGFKNLYSINSDDRLINRTGEVNPLETNPTMVRSNARWFTSNKVYSGQLNGDHLIGKKKFKMNWLLSYSDVNRSVPSLNRSIYTRLKTVNDPSDPNPRDTQWVANISGTNVGPSYGGGMFFSETKEYSTSAKVDFTYPFIIGEQIKTELKFGGLTQLRDRKFQARQLGYTKYNIVGGDISFDENLLYLPEDQIFSQQNMGLITPGVNGNPGKGGFKLTDGTKFSDAYDAGSHLHAGYLMLDNRFGTRREREKGGNGLRLIYGARAEYFNQILTARRADNRPLELNTKKLDILPSVNAIYSLTERQNLRLCYSQTVNRPEYRELAPFAFYDFTTNFVVSGNDSLLRAKIQNLDARYEIYPGQGQVFSATVFYKHFENPIEQISRPDVTSEISYRNVPEAQNYGLELEARMQLSSLIRVDSGSFINRMTIFSNLAIIRSVVDVSQVLGAIDDTRPLQGQSPYVFNAGLNYMNPSTNWGVAVNVNRVGPRIAIVGNVNEPDLWENARTFLDIQVTKAFLDGRAELKFNAANVLAQKQEFYQNIGEGEQASGLQGVFNTLIVGNKNNTQALNRSTDDVVWSTKFGPTLSLSFSYRF
jgi:TonB-dependent receptor